MTDAPAKNLHVGDTLTPIVRGPITRGTLALYAGASGDHTLFHIDSDYAKSVGFDDVFPQGMLSMAYLAQILSGTFRPEQLREWSVRFLASTPLHAKIHCSAEVEALFEEAGERRARLKLAAKTEAGLQTLGGRAIVALDAEE